MSSSRPLGSLFRLPRFYPILDTSWLAGRGFDSNQLASSLLEAGAKILQYRHKAPWTQREFDEAKGIAAMCLEAGALLVINDRADYARLLNAALHVGQDDLPPVAARSVVGPDSIIGFSTHNRQHLTYANDEPVQYVALGPVFATHSKDKPDPVLGLTGLKRLRPLVHKPLVAIGGITLANAAEVLAAGADSVAIISALGEESSTRQQLLQRARDWMALTN